MRPESAVGPCWSPVHPSSSQLEPSYCLPLCPRPMVLAYTHLMVDTKQEERKGPESGGKKIRRQVPSDLLTLLKFPEHSKTVASNEDQVFNARVCGHISQSTQKPLLRCVIGKPTSCLIQPWIKSPNPSTLFWVPFQSKE